MSLESLLPDLAARTVHAAELDRAWVNLFLPHIHIEHVRLDDDDWIVIRFDYLGATHCAQYNDQEDRENVITEAAESFGHTLRLEQEKFGSLPMPRSDYVPLAEWNAEQELRQMLRSMEATADRPLRLRARPTPMRAIAIGVLVLAVLAFGFIALATMGAFMTEQATASDLMENAVIAGVGLLLLWSGIRLLRRGE